MSQPVIVTKNGISWRYGEATEINFDTLGYMRPDQQLIQIVHWMFELGEDQYGDVLVDLVQAASHASLNLGISDETWEMIEEIRNESGSSYSYIIGYAIAFLRANLDEELRWLDNREESHDSDYHERYERTHGHPCPECQKLAIP